MLIKDQANKILRRNDPGYEILLTINVDAKQTQFIQCVGNIDDFTGNTRGAE